MGIVLSCYTREAFREYILPDKKNAEYKLALPGSYFGLMEGILLLFENLEGIWRLLPSGQYKIIDSWQEEQKEGVTLENQAFFSLLTSPGDVISVLTDERSRVFHPYVKYRLPERGLVRIGRNPENEIRYRRKEPLRRQDLISRSHARLERNGPDWHLEVMGVNGLYVNGTMAKSWVLSFGDHVNIWGLHLVFLGDALALDADARTLEIDQEILRPYGAGFAFGLPKQEERPRLRPDPRIRLLPEPEGDLSLLEEGLLAHGSDDQEMDGQKLPERSLFSALTAFTITDLLFAADLVGIHLPKGLGGGAVTVLAGAWAMAFWGVWKERKSQEEEKRQKKARQRSSLEATWEGILQEVWEANDRYRQSLCQLYPAWQTDRGTGEWVDPGEDGRRGLWQRTRMEKDFLRLRLGLGEASSPILSRKDLPRIRQRLLQGGMEKEQVVKLCSRFTSQVQIDQMPIILDLYENKQIGILGKRDKGEAVALARMLLVQAAAAYGDQELRIAVLYDRNDPADFGQWDFAKWLPHAWAMGGSGRCLAADRLQTEEVWQSLARHLRGKDGELSSSEAYYLIVLSDLSLLQEEKWARLLRKEEGRRATVLFLAREYAALPAGCSLLLESGETCQVLEQKKTQEGLLQEAKADRVSLAQAEEFSRYLFSCLPDFSQKETGFSEEFSFLEMYGVEDPAQLKIHDRWLKNRTYDGIRACLGKARGNRACVVDFHERQHGPHGLLAGTTGSGKSELLATLLLSLAVEYSPQDLSFLLIDFKGEALTGQFAALPHVAGTLSNLSPGQTRRVMLSVKSEMRRRQALFYRHGVRDIDSYTRLYKAGRLLHPLPHLLLVVDEFAQLKREQPDFIRELISVSQVGRSLGLHLLLSTQRPGGVVDDNIRGNASFRLCMRMQSRQDSREVLGREDAAEIGRVGAGIFLAGNGEVSETFQTAWSGAPYFPPESRKSQGVKLLTLTGKVNPISSYRRAKEEAKTGGEDLGNGALPTQLDAVCAYLAENAARYGFSKAPALWLPPLPAKLFLDALPPSSETGRTIPLGLLDDPENQTQGLFALPFPSCGNTAVVGTVSGGKTTFLRTLMASAVSHRSAEEIWLYAISSYENDFREWEGCPHVGGLVTSHEEDSLQRLFHLLEDLLEERRNQEPSRHPCVLLLLDDFGSFQETTEGKYEEQIYSLAREGPGRGIFLILTGGGIRMGELPLRLMDLMGTVIGLGLRDPAVCAQLFHLPPAPLPLQDQPPGRGLARKDGRLLELQVALPSEGEPSGQRKQERDQRERTEGGGTPARRLPHIPKNLDWETFVGMPQTQMAYQTGRSELPLGFDLLTADLCTLAFPRFASFLVAGEEGSGKKSFLRLIEKTVKEAKGLCFCLPKVSRDRDSLEGNEDLQAFLQVFEERRRRWESLREKGYHPDQARVELQKEPLAVLLIGDLADFFPAMAAGSPDLEEGMEKILEGGMELHMCCFGALGLERKSEITAYPLFKVFIRHKQGIHLGGHALRNTIFPYDGLSRQERNEPMPVGQGLLFPGSGEGVLRVVLPKV